MVSIIVPIYNCKEFLEECILSILEQTYKDIQVILIDDGSFDGSSGICDKFLEIDKRVEVVHKKNAGLVAARKSGVKLAKGEYLYFVDADDWIDSNTLDNLVHCIETYEADIVIDNAVFEYKDRKEYKKYALEKGVFSGREFIYKFEYSGVFFSFGALPNIWGKLYKTPKYIEIQNLVDNSIKIGEDVAVTIPYIFESQKIVWNENCYSYHYRQLDNSMVRANNNPKRFDESNCLFLLLEDKLKYDNLALEYLLYYYYSMLIGLLKNEANSGMNFKKLYNRFNVILNSYYYKKICKDDFLKTNTMGCRYRLLYYLIKKERIFFITCIFFIFSRFKH